VFFVVEDRVEIFWTEFAWNFSGKVRSKNFSQSPVEIFRARFDWSVCNFQVGADGSIEIKQCPVGNFPGNFRTGLHPDRYKGRDLV